MKTVFVQLLATYAQKAGKWLFAALLSTSLLPILLKSVLMLMKKNTLSSLTVVLLDLIAWITTWILLYVFVRILVKPPNVKFWQGSLQFLIRGGAVLAAISLLGDTLISLYIENSGLISLRGSTVFHLLGLILVMLFLCFLLSIFLFWLSLTLQYSNINPSIRKVMEFLLKKWKNSLLSILSLGVLLYMIPLFYDWILTKIPWQSLSFTMLTSGCILLTLMQWVILQPLVNSHLQLARIFHEDVYDREMGDGKSKEISFMRRQLPVILALAVIALSGLYSFRNNNPISAVSAIRMDIEYYLDFGKLMNKAGNFASAAFHNKIAEARVLAWQEVLMGKPQAMKEAVRLAPSDEQVLLLNALNNKNHSVRLSALERTFLEGSYSSAWYLALLNELALSTELNPLQEKRRDELLRLCILKGYYCRTCVMPEDLAGKQNALLITLKRLEDKVNEGRYYVLKARVGEDGGITEKLVYDALNLAETYPEDMNLQYLAMSYGSTLTIDKANHFKRTADAAIRYDNLYVRKYSKRASKDEKIREKVAVSKSLLACEAFETCHDFLSEVHYKAFEINMMKAACLFSLELYEPCQKVVDGLLKEEPDNAQALYMAGLGGLYRGEKEKSIHYAAQLARLVETSENKKEAECLLYPYVLRFTLHDQEAGYTTQAFSSLSDRELALLKGNELLYNYVTASHLWISKKRSEALVYLDKVLAVDGNLSRALYMKGAIYYEIKDFEKSMVNLKASLASDPKHSTAWYALALVYDSLEKYQESYAACQKALEYEPFRNHDSDVFGVSPHTGYLMDKLRKYLGGD